MRTDQMPVIKFHEHGIDKLLLVIRIVFLDPKGFLPSVVIDHAEAAKHCIRCRFLRCFHKAADHALINVIIRIKRYEPLTKRRTDAVVSGSGHSAVWLSQQTNTIIFLHQLMDDLRGIIRRAVIHDDDLQVPVVLIKYRPDCPLNGFFRIICGYDHADQRFIYQILCHSTFPIQSEITTIYFNKQNLSFPDFQSFRTQG